MSMETWKPRRFVEEFQKRAGLLIDGKPGPQTQIALELVPELPAPGRLYPAVPEMPEHLRTTPTPIDPADIRPGDLWEMRRRVHVQSVSLNDPELFWDELGNPWRRRDDWHLVHRPDPDAEAVEALRRAAVRQSLHYGGWPSVIARLREQGWDVTRRTES